MQSVTRSATCMEIQGELLGVSTPSSIYHNHLEYVVDST